GASQAVTAARSGSGGRISVGISAPQDRGDGLFQLRYARSPHGAGDVGVGSARPWREVRLGPDSQAWPVGVRRGLGTARSVSCLAGQQQVGTCGLLRAQGLGAVLDWVGGLIEPGGVDQLDRQTVTLAKRREVVTRGASLWRDERLR